MEEISCCYLLQCASGISTGIGRKRLWAEGRTRHRCIRSCCVWSQSSNVGQIWCMKEMTVSSFPSLCLLSLAVLWPALMFTIKVLLPYFHLYFSVWFLFLSVNKFLCCVLILLDIIPCVLQQLNILSCTCCVNSVLPSIQCSSPRIIPSLLKYLAQWCSGNICTEELFCSPPKLLHLFGRQFSWTTEAVPVFRMAAPPITRWRTDMGLLAIQRTGHLLMGFSALVPKYILWDLEIRLLIHHQLRCFQHLLCVPMIGLTPTPPWKLGMVCDDILPSLNILLSLGQVGERVACRGFKC